MNFLISYGGYLNLLILVLLPAVLVSALIFFLYARRLVASHTARRSESMRILAMKINFGYSTYDDRGVADRLESDKAFFNNTSGYVENLLYGTKNGIGIELFDYCLSELQKQVVTVCMLTLPSRLNIFKLTPLDEEANSTDDSSEEDEVYGGKYHIECPDKEFASKAFGEDMSDFLSRRRRTNIIGSGNILVFHRNKLLSPRSCYSLLDFAFGFNTKMNLASKAVSENKNSLEIQVDMYTD